MFNNINKDISRSHTHTHKQTHESEANTHCNQCECTFCGGFVGFTGLLGRTRASTRVGDLFPAPVAQSIGCLIMEPRLNRVYDTCLWDYNRVTYITKGSID